MAKGLGQSGTPPTKTSKAGRDLPAAIGVSLLLGAIIILTLVLAPRWVVILSVAMALATYEVVQRLRESGYSIPLIPLLVGGQLIIWPATWPPARRAGGLRRHGVGLPDLAAVEPGVAEPSGQPLVLMSPSLSSWPPGSRCSPRSPRRCSIRKTGGPVLTFMLAVVFS